LFKRLPLGGKLHKIKFRRLELGFTVADIAVLSGLSAQTIHRIERETPDDFLVRLDTAKLLAEALDVPMITLFESCEISEFGRPALTGRPIDELSARRQAKEKLKCPSCNVLGSQKDQQNNSRISECCNQVLVSA